MAITQRQAAHRVGVSQAAIHKAIRTGRIRPLGDYQDLASFEVDWRAQATARREVAQAVAGGAAELAAARLRSERAKAELAEMQVAERRGELLPAAEVVAGWQAAIGRARQRLLGVPSSVADELVLLVRQHDLDDKASQSIRVKLTGVIDQALRELANTSLDEDDDEPGPVAAD